MGHSHGKSRDIPEAIVTETASKGAVSFWKLFMVIMKTNWWKIALIILACVALAVGGFVVGRKTIKIDPPGVIYVPGDTISVNVPFPVPVEVVKPIDTANVLRACIESGKYYELFPEKIRDSIIYITKADTAAVLLDWATERFYEEQLFDIDTVGTAFLKAKVQYNRLASVNATFTPVTKVVTQPYQIKKYSPFIGGGLTTQPSVLGQAGLFFNDKYGFSGLYMYDWEANKHIFGTSFLLKF